MADMLISSCAFVGAIASIVFVCLDYNILDNINHGKCHHFFLTPVMIAIAAIILLNLMTFGLIKGTRKRMIRANDEALIAARTRDTITSVDDFIAQNVESTFSSGVPYEAARRVISKKFNHNYVNMIM